MTRNVASYVYLKVSDEYNVDDLSKRDKWLRFEKRPFKVNK